MSVVNNTNSNNQENIKSLPFYKTPTFITTASSVTLFGLWCLTRIHISKPNQYLVKTGMGIKEMKIGRNAIQWPFQQIINVDLNPKTISFDLKGMTEEKLQFKLPTVLTYTPCDPSEDPDGFKRYAKMMTEITPEQVAEIILGVAEGEVRTRTATMSVEQLFNDGASFRETVIKAVQEDLKQFGIFVRFGNFQELQDTSNHNYFGMRSTRAIEMANYEAQSNAAQSKRDGEISMENSKTTTRIAVAEAQKQAKLLENEAAQKIALSTAELAKVQAEADKITKLAQVESKMIAQQREVELQRQFDEKRRQQQTESHRATLLSKTIVDAESQERLADALYYQKTKEADAQFYTKSKNAEATLLQYNAQAEGLQRIIGACNNDPRLAQFYLALNSNLYPELARHQAEAVRGMQPKLSVITTGSNDDATEPVMKMIQKFAPMLQGLNDSGLGDSLGELKNKILGQVQPQPQPVNKNEKRE